VIHATDPLSDFIVAACVPLDGLHTEGTLERADAILAAHPDVARADIFAAAILGDADGVGAFLARDGALATARGGPHGWDALTHLCFSRYLRLDPARSEGFVRAATALLDAGASAGTGWYERHHTPKPTWESALYGAAGFAHHAGLTRLLLERGADPNDDEVPYHAPETYDNATVRVLADSGRLSADSLATMLLRKSDWHDLEGVRLLLARGADPNRMTRWGYTSLHQALRRDNAIEIVAALLDAGGDPTRMAADGWSGVSMAARRGRGEALAAFERRGIPIRLEGVERLLAACARNDAAAVGAIAGAEPDRVRGLVAAGGTALAEFAGNANADGMRRLLDLGVAVDAPYHAGDAYFDIAPGSTALHVAAWRSHLAPVRLLLERGAAVDARDGRDRTPLQLAVRACVDSYWTYRRTPDVVRALLEAGAPIHGVPVPCGYDEVDRLLRREG